MSVHLYEAICSNCRHLEGDHLTGRAAGCADCDCTGWQIAEPSALLDELNALRQRVRELEDERKALYERLEKDTNLIMQLRVAL